MFLDMVVKPCWISWLKKSFIQCMLKPSYCQSDKGYLVKGRFTGFYHAKALSIQALSSVLAKTLRTHTGISKGRIDGGKNLGE